MTKLLQIMAGAKVGGAEKFFERLAIAFENAGIKQRVAIRQNNDRTALLREAGIQPFEYRFGGILDLTTQRKIQNLTDDFEPDIILAWMSRGAQYLPKKVSQNCIRVARLGGYYNLKYFKKCDYLIGNTEDICTYLKNEGWPAEKVVYLPNFVDDTLAPPIDRSQFNTPESVPLLLGLGRLHENKAFDTGIKALVDIPQAYYWIAGEGPRRQELEDLAEKLGVSERVRFLGWRNDVPALLASADIFLCTSRHEPLGNMVIEAWAHQVPVVSVASQGPTQLIRHGENGLLSPIDNPSELAKNVLNLINNPDQAAELAISGNESYKTNFTEGQIVRKYEEFFDKIMAENIRNT